MNLGLIEELVIQKCVFSFDFVLIGYVTDKTCNSRDGLLSLYQFRGSWLKTQLQLRVIFEHNQSATLKTLNPQTPLFFEPIS